jgi:hypothetical protein
MYVYVYTPIHVYIMESSDCFEGIASHRKHILIIYHLVIWHGLLESLPNYI